MSTVRRANYSSRIFNKKTGSFYTPENLAYLLARETLDAWQKLHPTTPLKTLRVLDPAAGEGGLLLPFAQELATRRAVQEPNTPQTEILQDIVNRQLFAADISQIALLKTGLPNKHLYFGDALAHQDGKSVLDTWGPFDILLANPPYIGQKGNAALFDKLRENPLWSQYVTPKNDLLYYFFYLALHMLKPGGLAGFITTPYFATAAGGKLLRKTLHQKVTFLRLINFENQRLFKQVNQHTLLSVFTYKTLNLPCKVGLQTPSMIPAKQLFYGPDLFLKTQLVVENQNLLTRMARAPHTLGEIAQISTGLMTGCDRAFILTNTQKNALSLTQKELTKLKPFFKNSNISAYVPELKPRLWLIDFFYPNDRDLKVKDYPHLLAHLTQFKEKLLARKQNNNGIDKQLVQGKFWFASVRRRLNFEGEKLVLPHRSTTVKAAYVNGPWYASSDVYFITNPKLPYTLWTILGLLNSAPYLAWLKAHGKRKGELLELYSAPLKQLPVPNLALQKQTQLENLTRAIYQQVGNTENTLLLQKQLDELVVSCFD